MILKVLAKMFAVCKVKELSAELFSGEFCFVSKTDEEISAVVESGLIPTRVTDCDDGWNAFRVEGVLDFSLVGILAKIANILAENEIPIFAVSTFDTDYILMKFQYLVRAVAALRCAGYTIINE